MHFVSLINIPLDMISHSYYANIQTLQWIKKVQQIYIDVFDERGKMEVETLNEIQIVRLSRYTLQFFFNIVHGFIKIHSRAWIFLVFFKTF